MRLAEHVIPARPDTLRPLLDAHVPCGLLEPLPGDAFPFSMARRQATGGEIVLLFNESWADRTATVRFCQDGGAVTQWNPQTGALTRLRDESKTGETLSITLRAAQTLIVSVDSVDDNR